MRIRLFRAFASNNSGSYTLVGEFGSPVAATEAEGLLREVCAAHSAWYASNAQKEDGDSPLDAFARAHGLSAEKQGRGDDWPQFDPPPEVLTVGRQLLVYVVSTLNMPRLIGEFIYRRGGRVGLELVHSHDLLAVEFTFIVRGAARDTPEQRDRYDALERALDPLLPELVKRQAYETHAEVAPLFHDTDWGGRRLTAVFPDLVLGARTVRDMAAAHGVDVLLRVTECTSDMLDPLAPLRSKRRSWGRSKVILWSLGEDRIAALKIILDASGASLAEAKDLLEDLPKEILLRIDQGSAERTVLALRAAGCDAEAVIPIASR